MAGTRGFWGSVETGGGEVMINLRRVRYARPVSGGTRLFFDGGDVVEVAASFDLVSHRLYQAYDDDAQSGEEQGGEEQGGDGDEDGEDEGGGGGHSGSHAA